MSFQWVFQRICISLRGLRLFCHVVWLGTGQFQRTNGTIGTTRKSCHCNGSTGEYAEKTEFIHVMFNQQVGVFYQGIMPRGEDEWVIMKCPCFVCVCMSIKLIDCIPSLMLALNTFLFLIFSMELFTISHRVLVVKGPFSFLMQRGCLFLFSNGSVAK